MRRSNKVIRIYYNGGFYLRSINQLWVEQDMNMYEMLKQDEGEVLKPYECSEGFLTIGIGHNLDANGISKAASEFIFNEDLQRFRAQLASCEYSDIYQALDDARKMAILNMCFNMGINSLCKFKNMWRALRIGDYKEAALQAKDSHWYNQVKSRGDRICHVIENGNLESYK